MEPGSPALQVDSIPAELPGKPCEQGTAVLCLITQRVQSLVTPWTAACQAPLSMGILQARVLERVAMPSSRGSSQPGDQTWSPALQADFETPGN